MKTSYYKRQNILAKLLCLHWNKRRYLGPLLALYEKSKYKYEGSDFIIKMYYEISQ